MLQTTGLYAPKDATGKKLTVENLFYVEVLFRIPLHSGFPGGSDSGRGINQSSIHIEQTVPDGSVNGLFP